MQANVPGHDCCAWQEECRGWDLNEIVFSPSLWPTYHNLMRADFTLFDEYEYTHKGASLLLSQVYNEVHNGCSHCTGTHSLDWASMVTILSLMFHALQDSVVMECRSRAFQLSYHLLLWDM